MKKTIAAIILMISLSTGTIPCSNAKVSDPDFHMLFDGHGSVMLIIHSETGAREYANKAAAVFSSLYNYGNKTVLFLAVYDITEGIHQENNRRVIYGALGVTITLLLLAIGLLLRFYKMQKDQNQEIRNSNELQQTFIDAEDSLVYLKDENLKYVFVNRALEQFFGKTSSQIIGRGVFDLADEGYASQSERMDREVLKKGTRMTEELKWDGKVLESSKFPVRLTNGKYGVGAYVRDITERKKAEREIAWLSYHDSLTGLYNRRFFEKELERLDTQRNLPISIIMGDVNGLKLTNDVFGHTAGDVLLKKAADVIRSACRSDDIIARWGGDEYIIILPGTTREAAEKVVGRIKDVFGEHRIKGLRGSISLGFDSKEQEEEGIYEVIERAEKKMYLSKTLDHKIYNKRTIKGIMETLHKMSSDQEKHSKRVSQWCEKTGRALDLSDDQVKQLKDAGYYHDIGKIALEEELLNKKGSLTPQELLEMRQHPVIGYRILNSSEETLELARDVLCHHEAWDGSGYPKGLKGEDIPLTSRIIAVAEGYEALREDLDREEALAELRKKAGSQFDPAIVEVFVGMVEQAPEIP